ncbi:MAG: prepilin-type N-terminal cleavage/methylation domain-containing protein [Gemmatimonadetes bacterium]|nr:prepilin-type N-terminal cleavage/methylation domain-containing protein [Gemmatimonadota bacterium]NNM03491.1 prepilin-type N-terminal cleavage/methylation domain-containing protein [Gemmatimonadota bacterium]
MVTKEHSQTIPSPEDRSAIPPKGQQGFTIVEVIVAIMVLAIGLLGLAGTTMLVIKQTTLADITSDRAVVLQSTLEQIRATPYDSVAAGSETSGLYQVAWNVIQGNRWKSVEVVTTGPGLARSGGYPVISHSVTDTFTYRIISQ